MSNFSNVVLVFLLSFRLTKSCIIFDENLLVSCRPPTITNVIKIVICNQQMKVCLALGKLKMSRLTHFTFYHDFKIVKLSPVGRQIFKVTILLCTKWPFYLGTKKSIRFMISQRIGILAIEEKNVAQCGKSEIFLLRFSVKSMLTNLVNKKRPF